MREPRDVDWNVAINAGATDPAECVEVKATDPLYVLYTSGTTGKPKGIVRDNGGHAVAMAWSLPNIYDVHPGEVWWTASDVGWVVGHSYIVYSPLISGVTTVLYEGKPVGTPDAGAFWRVIAEHRVAGALHRAHRHPRDPEGGPRGQAARGPRHLVPADPVPGRRAARPGHLPLGDREAGRPGDRQLVADRDGLADRREPARPRADGRQAGLTDRAGPRLPGRRDRRGWHAGRRGRGGGGLPQAAAAPGHADHPVARRRALRVVVPVGVRGLLPLRRRRVHRRGRLRLRDGPHRRRHQRGRAPALDRLDGGHHRHPPGGRRVCRHRRRRPAEGPAAAGVRGAQGRRRAGPRRAGRELVARVRDEIGAVAAFRDVTVVGGLPKTRSGKILRKTMREIADGKDAKVPSTIEDPGVLDDLRPVLRRE